VLFARWLVANAGCLAAMASGCAVCQAVRLPLLAAQASWPGWLRWLTLCCGWLAACAVWLFSCAVLLRRGLAEKQRRLIGRRSAQATAQVGCAG